jgi:hypothetical protein
LGNEIIPELFDMLQKNTLTCLCYWDFENCCIVSYFDIRISSLEFLYRLMTILPLNYTYGLNYLRIQEFFIFFGDLKL